MTSRSREFLAWCGPNIAETPTNFARPWNKSRWVATGKRVILPVDQGFEHGTAHSFAPVPPAYNTQCHFELATEAEAADTPPRRERRS